MDAQPSLAGLTSLRVGGPAGTLVRAGSATEVVEALRSLAGADDPDALTVLSGGSNVVISDAGLPAVLLVTGGGIAVEPDPGAGAVRFVVDAGVDWDELVTRTVEAGCAGLELLSGVPGSVGAAPIQNIAAYGQQVCDVIETVEVVDRATLATEVLAGDDCAFGFRTSRFKTDWAGRFVVTRVTFRLVEAAAAPPPPSTYVDIEKYFERNPGSPTDVADRRAAVLATRRRKSMVLDPDDPDARSAGSFFINPLVPEALAVELAGRFATAGLGVQYLEGRSGAAAAAGARAGEGHRRVPAAHLLRVAGCRPGDSWGPVGLSTKHVLALVTRPGATAEDVWQVGSALRHRVAEHTGVHLDFEPNFIGAFGEFDPDAFARRYAFEPGPSAEPEWLASYR